MPSRRRRPLPPPAVHPLTALPPADRAAAIAEVAAAIDAIAAALVGCPIAGALDREGRLRLRSRWHAELPAVARDLAELLDGEPAIFARSHGDGAALRAGADEVGRLAGVKARLDALSGWVSDLLLIGRADLFDRAGRLLRAVDALPDSGQLPAADVARVLRAAAPAAARLERRHTDIQRTKRARAALRGGPAAPRSPAGGSRRAAALPSPPSPRSPPALPPAAPPDRDEI